MKRRENYSQKWKRATVRASYIDITAESYFECVSNDKSSNSKNDPPRDDGKFIIINEYDVNVVKTLDTFVRHSTVANNRRE